MRSFILSVFALLFLAVSVAAAPTVTIHSPSQNQFLNSTTLFINVSSNSIVNFSFSIDTSAFDLFGQNTTSASTTINISEGSHTLSVRVTDGLNVSSASLSFSVDTTSPIIALNFPDSETNFQTQESTFVFTSSDNLASSLNCTLLIDDKEKQSKILLENPKKVEMKEIVGEGKHTWSISCKDQHNNAKSEARNFSVDSVCGIYAYGIGVQNDIIQFFLKNTGTKNYFTDYRINVDLDQLAKDFVQLKIGESKLIQKPFSFQTNKNYLIEAFSKSDCGKESSLSMQYSKISPACTGPDGFSSQIKCDEPNRRQIQCSNGVWTEYSRDEYLYCNSCSHCGDGVVNCGETEFSCQQDYRRQATCDCTNKRQVVGNTVLTGSDFYNSCKGVCNLECSSDFQCSTNFCLDFKCAVRPGDCDLSIDDLEYNLQTPINSSTYLISTIKNIGQIPTNITLDFKIGSSLNNQSLFNLNVLESVIKTFYFSINQPGIHNVSLLANASCGFSASKSVEIEVVNKTITYLNLTVPLLTSVDLEPISIITDQGKDNTIRLNIKTTRPQIFSLNVTGVPDSWLSYQKSIGTGRERDVYIHVLPRNSGEYNLSVVLVGENQIFRFNPLVTVLEQETIGEQTLITVLAVIAVLFIVILFFAFRRFEHEELDLD